MKRMIALIFFAPIGLLADEAYEVQIVNAIESLRAIRPTHDKQELANFNHTMDKNWVLFRKDRAVSIPVLVNALKKENELPQPSDLVLLDLAWFLSLNVGDDLNQIPVLLKAYERIEFKNLIIQQNEEEMFRLSLFFSDRQLPGFLRLIDERYLRKNSGSFFIPQHVATVGSHAQRTHLYGIYGKGSIRHLLDMLKSEDDVATRRSLTSILRRICTVDCAADIFALLSNEKDHETFVNGTYIMLDNAGPLGRKLYLELAPLDLTDKTQVYFQSERAYAEKQSFEFLVAKMEKKYGKSGNALSDAELLSETEKMINNAGSSGVLHPLDFINSKLSKEMLTGKLIESRRKCFLRLNRHGMEDIDITNMVLNTLQYRAW